MQLSENDPQERKRKDTTDTDGVGTTGNRERKNLHIGGVKKEKKRDSGRARKRPRDLGGESHYR